MKNKPRPTVQTAAFLIMSLPCLILAAGQPAPHETERLSASASEIQIAYAQALDMTRQQKDQKGKNELLLAAVNAGNVKLVAALIKQGASVEARDPQQRTALILAAIADHLEVVRVLLDNRADMTAVDYQGWNAMTYAVDMGHDEVMYLLMERASSSDLCGSLPDEASETTKTFCKKLSQPEPANSFGLSLRSMATVDFSRSYSRKVKK